MASATSERLELAKLCSSRDWSKAIRVLDSLLSQSCVIQDICNRAFCYSQLELHKHVIKDCEKALQLDPTLLQAYILKGRALFALGKKEDALLVWELGYGYAVRQSADLKLFLELEELLKQNRKIVCENNAESPEPSTSASKPALPVDEKSNSTHKNFSALNDESELCSELSATSESHDKAFDASGGQDVDASGGHDGLRDTVNGNKKLNSDVFATTDSHDELRDTVNGNKKLNSESNGINDTLNKSSDESELSDTSERSSKSSSIYSKPSDLPAVCRKSSNKYDIRSEFGFEANRNKKFGVTRISKTKSISVDFRLSRGIAQVNEGNYSTAISIFDQILKEDPTYPEALVGRGTAYAFQRELSCAIADFTKAIESNPSACEAWKRRGQARAALGESVEAIEDLTKALEFEPNSADILHERGIVNFKFKDFNAAVEDLSACVQLDKENKSAYTYLGLALSSIGEYGRAKEAHMKSIELDQNFLEGWAHLTQFYQDLANSTKALECIERVLKIDDRFAKAYHLRGLLRHGMGEHKKAITDLSKGLGIENSNIECLYLRASCYHAIGEYGEAIKDYDKALKLELDSMEKFVLQCLAFYQKELALYAASKMNSEFSSFDIDNDINPLFKEYWCKRLHPQHVSENVFRQPSLKRSRPRKIEFSVTKQKIALLQAADSIGKKIQYQCPGFLSNRRQHRMAGLAAIEIAQKVSKAWRSLHFERNRNTSKHGKKARRKEKINMPSQNRGGACCTTSSAETSTLYRITEDRSSGRPIMSWHDVYSLAVKWRQISEPCDPVVWVNKLSEEFNSGFGSHTPLILGQAKVVRYFPNYQRALDVAKIVIKEKKYVHNKADDIVDLSKDGKLQEILHAESCSDLHRIVGEDFWVATWCNSTAFEGRQLEGTRITLLKMGQHGFDFAIRTPCTPSRWEDFDAEMAVAWEALCNAYCGEAYGSTEFDLLEKVRDAILRMTYYWYNFMPLSRGTAVVGFVVLLGLFLAANMEFTGSIPKDVQVDWDAILNFEPDSFLASVKSWLCPSLNVSTSWKDYPDVVSTFSTTASVVAALSSYDD